MGIKSQTRLNKKILLSAAGGTLLIIGVVAALELAGFTNFFGKPAIKPSAEDASATTTSTQQSAQAGFTGGEARATETKPKSEGYVSDTNGAIGSIPPASSWSRSADGSIIVYTPAKDALLTNGSTISGTSGHDTVYFRLIDDVSGVIAQGSLKVTAGKFSGNLSFSTSARLGRVDVFTASPEGIESNNIEIPVRFK